MHIVKTCLSYANFPVQNSSGDIRACFPGFRLASALSRGGTKEASSASELETHPTSKREWTAGLPPGSTFKGN
jgi:hypothetical protein